MSASTNSHSGSPVLRWAVIAAIAGIAFFASYRYAVAAGTAAPFAAKFVAAGGSAGASPAVSGGTCCGGGAGSTAAGSGSTTGGTCCGGGAGSTAAAKGIAVTKSAKVNGAVQAISVDLSKGYYDPSTIRLKAGVPAAITFGRSSGCTGVVQSQQLGFSEDLSGGPKTVKLAGLRPGTYRFACGMGMVTGTIVVE